MPVALPACAADPSFKFENEKVTAVLAGMVPAVSVNTNCDPTGQAQDTVTPATPLTVADGVVPVSKKPAGYSRVIVPLVLLMPPPAEVLKTSLPLEVTFETTRSVLDIEKPAIVTALPMLPDANPGLELKSAPSASRV